VDAVSAEWNTPEKQDKARKAVIRKLRNARREIIRAVERAATVDDLIGMREGHKAEARRLCDEIRVEAIKAVEAFRE